MRPARRWIQGPRLSRKTRPSGRTVRAIALRSLRRARAAWIPWRRVPRTSAPHSTGSRSAVPEPDYRGDAAGEQLVLRDLGQTIVHGRHLDPILGELPHDPFAVKMRRSLLPGKTPAVMGVTPLCLPSGSRVGMAGGSLATPVFNGERVMGAFKSQTTFRPFSFAQSHFLLALSALTKYGQSLGAARCRCRRTSRQLKQAQAHKWNRLGRDWERVAWVFKGPKKPNR